MDSELYRVLDTKVIAGLIDRRKPLPSTGLDIFKNRTIKYDGKFELEFDVKYGRPIIAPVTGFNAPSVPHRRSKMKKLLVTPITTKIHRVLNEAEKMRLRAPGETTECWGDRMNADAANELGEAIMLTKEYFLWQALHGLITYESDLTNMRFSIDFGMSVSHKVTLSGAEKWDVPATSNPLGDIEQWVAIFERDCGVVPEKIVMNRFTLKNAMASSDLIAILAPTLRGGSLQAAFTEYVKTITGGCELVVYQGPYEAEDGTAAYMVNDGEVMLFHTKCLQLASAASEYNKSGNSYKAGPFSSTKDLDDPLGVKVIAGENFIPILEEPDAAFYVQTY